MGFKFGESYLDEAKLKKTFRFVWPRKSKKDRTNRMRQYEQAACDREITGQV